MRDGERWFAGEVLAFHEGERGVIGAREEVTRGGEGLRQDDGSDEEGDNE